MIKNSKIKIGLVGCGRISKYHIDSIFSFKNFNLISICDNNQKKLDNYKHLDCLKYLSLNKMLKENQFDILVICTPNGLHFKQAKLALEHNVNVIVEKPLSLSSLQCTILKNEFKKKKLFIFVVMQNRFNPTISFLKKIKDKNYLGKINFVIINVLWNRPQSYFSQDKWRGTKKYDGGVMINQAIHYIDLIEWLIGPVKTISSLVRRIDRKIETEDSATAIIEWKNNTIGSLNISVLAHEKNFEGSITILAKNGNIKIGGRALNEITSSTISKKILSDNKIKNLNYYNKNVYGNGHVIFYENLLKYLKTKKNILPSVDDAINVLKIIEAIKYSSNNKKVLKI